MREKVSTITTADRFEYGEFSLKEICQLKNVCLTRVYQDIVSGRLPIVKRGRSTRVLGRVARNYVPGEGVNGEAARVAPAAESAPQKKRGRPSKVETVAAA
ncbi:hypothetical protein [Methylocystis sp.]|uniref:hypothetical protein n=1 Tax=Methylocystis sp. TaxID=1911079 RepID=UPI00273740B4|nr:hypothetical protein [Methylocystis sp.]MDP3553094.1 hypothetical protein [Methylocystis sp.]